MFQVRTVSYSAPDAPAEFTRSMRETGFAVLTDHPISPDQIHEAYDAWAGFFASDDKHDYKVQPGAHDGFFLFGRRTPRTVRSRT